MNPGDEVVLIAPFYDSYPAAVAMAGGVAKYVTLEAPDFRLTREALEAACSPKTRAILVNTPHNPTGRVFDRSELELVAEFAKRSTASSSPTRSTRTSSSRASTSTSRRSRAWPSAP